MSTKEAVLLELLMRSDSVSGERLRNARRLPQRGLKAIAQLREDGHQIEAATNRGYRLADPREILSEAGPPSETRWRRAFGREIELHREIDSTNRRAKGAGGSWRAPRHASSARAVRPAGAGASSAASPFARGRRA